MTDQHVLALKKAFAAHMLDSGITTAELARRANVSRTIADRWLDERRDTTMAGMETCAKALGLGIKVQYRDLSDGTLKDFP